MADARARLVAAAVAAATVAVAGAALWWSRLPRTPEALYRDRCSSCHALADVCGYGARARGEIVHVMRARHGAQKVIDDQEAVMISRFMRETLRCR